MIELYDDIEIPNDYYLSLCYYVLIKNILVNYLHKLNRFKDWNDLLLDDEMCNVLLDLFKNESLTNFSKFHYSRKFELNLMLETF